MTTRADGRFDLDLRPLGASFGELDRADGSARFSFGSTSSLASFSGPIEVRLREELPTRATLEVVHRPLEGIGATPSRALEQTLSSLLTPLLHLEQHTRTLVQLVVQSLSPSKLPSASYPSSSSTSKSTTWPPLDDVDGDATGDENDLYVNVGTSSTFNRSSSSPTSLPFASRASAINATALSILSASSISLRAIPLAISLALLPPPTPPGSSPGANTGRGKGRLVVDPTMEEEALAQARFGFAWAIGSGISTSGGNSKGVQKGGGEMEVDGMVEGEVGMELVWIESEGDFSRAEFDDALRLSKGAVKEVLGFVRERAGEYVAKRIM